MSVTLSPPAPATDRTAHLLRWLLYVFVGTMVFSLAGSLLLRFVPAVVPFFGPYYPSLVKFPTWVYMALLPVLPVLMYTRSLGGWLMAFFVGWGCLVGGMSELIGTQTGFPFGKYGYSDWLGPKLMGQVPYFIPFSWFAMSILSLDLASRIVARRYERILVAALFMVLWDVSLDPAMSRAFPFWHYPEGGFYYGMPALNWLGWFVVSGIIVWGFEVIGGGLKALHPKAPLVYLLNCLFPLLLCLVYDVYAAFFIGSLATALPLLAVRGRHALHHAE